MKKIHTMKRTNITIMKLTAITFLTLALGTVGAWADGVIDILPDGVTTTVLASPGSYRLAGSVTATAGQTPIIISAEDVTLDLNGYTIDGAGITAYCVIIYGDRARVHSGNIVNASAYGVYASNTDGLWIHDIQVSGSSSRGIEVTYVNGAVVERCVVRENFYGIRITDGAESAIVRQCQAIDNSGYGIDVNDGNDHVISGNVSTGNATGFRVSSATATALFIDNVATGNTMGYNDSSSGSLFVNNTAMGNASNYVGISSVTSQAASNEFGDNLTP